MFEFEFDKIGAVLCLPFKGNPSAELTFVMVVCPAVLNIIQYWIQDNILMDGRKTEPEYVLVGVYLFVHACFTRSTFRDLSIHTQLPNDTHGIVKITIHFLGDKRGFQTDNFESLP